MTAWLNALTLGAVTIDRNGRILAVNRAAAALLGVSARALRGHAAVELVVGGLQGDRLGAGAGLPEGRSRLELAPPGRNGQRILVDAHTQRMELSSGPVLLSLWWEVSDRRVEDDEQRRSLVALAHELRHPLAAARIHAELLRQERGAIGRRAQLIMERIDQLDRMLGDLLFLSRLEAGQLQLRRRPCDLIELAQAAVSQVQRETNDHALVLRALDQKISGEWDSDRLMQVLQNLLSNAVKYSPGGGEIVVEVGRHNGDAQVAVQDSGIGIPPEALPRVFERGFRAESAAERRRGLGMGLYICKLLVTAHGGQIWAESPGEGMGSTFTFTLPTGADPPEVQLANLSDGAIPVQVEP